MKKRLHRLMVAAAAAMLIVAMLPSSVAAADPTHLAGKPINGKGFGTGSTCHATIYGKVNYAMVLFIPYHCSEYPGFVYRGQHNIRLGVTGPWLANISSPATDMAWIVLDAGNYPASNRHRIYVGSTSYYNTAKVPSSTVSCSGMQYTDSFRTGYWPTNTTSQGPWSGNVYTQSNHSAGCNFVTNFSHGLGTYTIPSGAPLWNYTRSQFVGDAFYTHNGNMAYASWRQAMINLRTLYGTGGTYFCSNSACN